MRGERLPEQQRGHKRGSPSAGVPALPAQRSLQQRPGAAGARRGRGEVGPETSLPVRRKARRHHHLLGGGEEKERGAGAAGERGRHRATC